MDNSKALLDRIRKRYGNIEPEALEAILTPVLIPVIDIDKNIVKLQGQTHWRASFVINIEDAWAPLMQRGTTGKFVPASYTDGGVWREICKGRIIDVDWVAKKAYGEVYVGKKKTDLSDAVKELNVGDFLEIDQFGASAKILSSLAEYYLAKLAKEQGFKLLRMPEDTAKHLGAYYNYDFEFEKNGITKKIEVKSLWGTNTNYARLIHSTTSKPKGPENTWTAEQKRNYYPTSSCKFATQDIFAVNLFLRTGNIREFAFARSVSIADKPYGLPYAEQYPEHVNQNPICEIGNGSWFATLDEVWNL